LFSKPNKAPSPQRSYISLPFLLAHLRDNVSSRW
jgi:hypothetical protein